MIGYAYSVRVGMAFGQVLYFCLLTHLTFYFTTTSNKRGKNTSFTLKIPYT